MCYRGLLGREEWDGREARGGGAGARTAGGRARGREMGWAAAGGAAGAGLVWGAGWWVGRHRRTRKGGTWPERWRAGLGAREQGGGRLTGVVRKESVLSVSAKKYVLEDAARAAKELGPLHREQYSAHHKLR